MFNLPDTAGRAGCADRARHVDLQICFPDLAFVPDHFTASSAKRLWERQLGAIGLQTCAEVVRLRSAGVDAILHGEQTPLQLAEAASEVGNHSYARWLRLHTLQALGSLLHIRVFVVTTDAGTDQVGCHKLMVSEAAADPHTWIVWNFCFQHQLHLIVKSQLAGMGSYFSTIAKMTNTWRASMNAQRIFRVWKRLYGEARAKKVAGRLPPRALRGRWGSIDDVETFFLHATKPECERVFKEALGPTLDKKRGSSAAGTLALADEDEEAYRQKVGTWTRDSIDAVAKHETWISIHIAHLTRRPLMHMMHWLQKGASLLRKFRENLTSSEDAGPSGIQQLVYFKAAEIQRDFDLLLCDAAYGEEVCWGGLWGHVDEAQLPDVRARCVGGVLETAAGYHMRVSSKVKAFPLKLCWLVFAPASQVCEERRSTAKALLALLDKPEGDVETFSSTAWKIAHTFREELLAAVASGTLHERLFHLIQAVCRMMTCDTQEIEGMNSIIKHAIHHAPAIHLPLLNSRVLIKKSLTDLGQSSDALDKIVRQCVEAHSIGQAALEDPGRYYGYELEPTPIQGPPAPLPLQDSAGELPRVGENPDGAADGQPGQHPGHQPEQDGQRQSRDEPGPDVEPEQPQRKRRRRRRLSEFTPEELAQRCIVLLIGMFRSLSSSLQPGATRAVLFTLVDTSTSQVVRREGYVIAFKYYSTLWAAKAAADDRDYVQINRPLEFVPLLDVFQRLHETLNSASPSLDVVVSEVRLLWDLPSLRCASVGVPGPADMTLSFREHCCCKRQAAQREQPGQREQVPQRAPLDLIDSDLLDGLWHALRPAREADAGVEEEPEGAGTDDPDAEDPLGKVANAVAAAGILRAQPAQQGEPPTARARAVEGDAMAAEMEDAEQRRVESLGGEYACGLDPRLDEHKAALIQERPEFMQDEMRCAREALLTHAALASGSGGSGGDQEVPAGAHQAGDADENAWARDVACVKRLVHEWVDGFKLSFDAIQSAAKRNLQKAMNNDVSLVLEKDHESGIAYCRYLHWDDVDAMVGRRVLLDDAERLIYCPPTRKENLASAFESGALKLCINSVGVKMTKAKGIFRSDMPKDILRARRCIDIASELGATSSGDSDFIAEDRVSEGVCLACRSAKLAGEGGQTLPTTCPLCHLRWHPVCQTACLEAASNIYLDNPELDENCALGPGAGPWAPAGLPAQA